MGEVMATFTGILLLMCTVIGVPNFFRKLVWNLRRFGKCPFGVQMKDASQVRFLL